VLEDLRDLVSVVNKLGRRGSGLRRFGSLDGVASPGHVLGGRARAAVLVAWGNEIRDKKRRGWREMTEARTGQVSTSPGRASDCLGSYMHTQSSLRCMQRAKRCSAQRGTKGDARSATRDGIYVRCFFHSFTINTNSAISSPSTMIVNAITSVPLVLNGRPQVRADAGGCLCSCGSCSEDSSGSRWMSAKSWLERRRRKTEITSSRAARMMYSSPTVPRIDTVSNRNHFSSVHRAEKQTLCKLGRKYLEDHECVAEIANARADVRSCRARPRRVSLSKMLK
jgi:hypothetical protein